MRIGADSSVHLMSSSPWLITLQGVWIYPWRMVHQVDFLHSHSAMVDNPVMNRGYFQCCGITQGAGRMESKIRWAYIVASWNEEQYTLRVCKFWKPRWLSFWILKEVIPICFLHKFFFLCLFLLWDMYIAGLSMSTGFQNCFKVCVWIRRALCWWVWARVIPWVGGFLSWHISWVVSRTLSTTTKACTKYYGLRALSGDYCWDLEAVVRWTEQLHILLVYIMTRYLHLLGMLLDYLKLLSNSY